MKSLSSNPAVSVEPGRRIASTQAAQAWSELAWKPGVLPGEFALEARGQARTAANDHNSVYSPGFGLVNPRWSYSLPITGRDALQLLARVDNAIDRTHVGSVIVNNAKGHLFEPGAPRNWTGSLRWMWRG